jgi:hypothetical protein
MKRLVAIPTSLLVAWTGLSIAFFALGVGFAGGLDKIELLPVEPDPLSLVLLALPWAFMITPIALLALRLVRSVVRRRDQ